MPHLHGSGPSICPAVPGLGGEGGEARFAIQGGRSYVNLAVCPPVTSGGTRCRQYALGIWLWAALLQVRGCPIWYLGTGRSRRGPGSECILLVPLLLGGVPAWRGSALGSVRTGLPPSGLSASPKLQLKVEKDHGELPGGSKEDEAAGAPCPWDPQTLEGGGDVVAPEVRVPV